jgi:hypothetical protein
MISKQPLIHRDQKKIIRKGRMALEHTEKYFENKNNYCLAHFYTQQPM